MNNLLIQFSVKWQMLKDKLKEENGQDLIEYALVISVIGMGATASMSTVATAVSHIFTTISTKIASNIS